MTDDLTPARAAGDVAGDITPDLEAIARSLPLELPGSYEQLRNLLRTLSDPTNPLVRSARASPANPASEASQFGDPLNLAGGPIGQSSGTEIGSGIAGLDIYGTPALAGGGFPAAWRRFLTGGVYNGDFGLLPLVPGNNVDNITNPLPYWLFTQSVQTTVTCKGAAAAVPSGGVLSLTMTASVTAGDEGYVEQIVPINGSFGKSFSYAVAATQTGQSAGGSRPNLFLETQFLKSDKVTTTGTADRVVTPTGTGGVSTIVDIVSNPNAGLLPLDAYWLRIRIGLVATAIGQAVTNSVSEVRLFIGPTRVYIANDGSFASAYWETIAASKTVILRAGGSTRFTSEAPYRFPNVPAEFPCNALLAAGTVAADLAGCTTTITTTYLRETVIVWGIFDVDITAASTATAVGALVVDGVTQAAIATFRQNTSPGRATVMQQWVLTFNDLVATAHTLKLQGSKTAALGTINFNATHTKMVVERQG